MTEAYVCHFCHTPHNNLSDYAKCVQSCNAKLEERKKRDEQTRIATEQKRERERRETAKADKLAAINAKKEELEVLYSELYREYPEYRGVEILNTAGVLEEFLPWIFDLRGATYGA